MTIFATLVSEEGLLGLPPKLSPHLLRLHQLFTVLIDFPRDLATLLCVTPASNIPIAFVRIKMAPEFAEFDIYSQHPVTRTDFRFSLKKYSRLTRTFVLF